MQVKIERGNDVNAVLFDALGDVGYKTDPKGNPYTLDTALAYLEWVFEGGKQYRFYKGGNHISVHSKFHEKRIALISV